MTKRIVHGLKLTKIAAVDFPCQEPALAAIVKSLGGAAAPIVKKLTVWHDADGKVCVEHDTTPGKVIRKAMCEAITKGGISLTDGDTDDGAQLFDAVLGQEKLTQKFWDDFYKGTQALQQSLLSIIKDDDVAEKSAMIDTSLKEFAAYIGEILPGAVGKALAAGIAATIAGGARTTDQGDTMSDALKKALGLTATATEAEVLKALEDRDTLAKGLVAPLTIEQAAYMGKMAPAEQLDFQKADSKARDAKMKAEPKEDVKEDDVAKAIAAGDAFRTLDGNHLVLKSKVGPDQFAILKGMDDGRRSDRATITKNEDEKIAKAFEDQAVDLGFAKAFAPTLRKAFNGDAEAQGLLAKEIKALRAIAEKSPLFKEMGGGAGDGAGTAQAELVAKAQEYQKANPGKTYEQAYAAVYKDRGNAEIVKRMRSETAQA